MKIETRSDTPTITETREAIIIRIPKGWVADSDRRPVTAGDILRIVAAGEREFREGKTQEVGAFLAKYHPAHARTYRRTR